MRLPRPRGVPGRNTLERRLFSWLLTLLLVPTLLVLAAGAYAAVRSVELIGTLGPWNQVAESGRILVDAAAADARSDSTLARAIDNHQRNLSASLTQARRWTFLGHRAAAALPWLLLLFALLLVALSLWLSRRIARELARPIAELVEWADLMGRGASLPDAPATMQGRRTTDVSEVQTLRIAMRDASDRIARAQRQALEQERVRAWGEMARRVAHEMKNPLTPLRLAVHRIAPGADPETIGVIEDEMARLEDLARQFGVLGRPSTGTVSDIDLVELLASLLHSDVPSHIETSVHADREHVIVPGYYDALHRAFRNLVRNAVDAVSGRPRTGSDETARGPDAIRVTISGTSDEITVEMADTGPGIPPSAVDRIFEPDYTLKAGGTGLGLAVVRQAIAAHQGTISASNTASGALFRVTIPAAGVTDSGIAQQGNEGGNENDR